MSTFKPTAENLAIINAVDTGKNVAIRARAGTGKTTTLKYIARSFPEKTVLAVYFNKANAEELNNSDSRPSNMIGTTIHSLAYRAVISGTKRKPTKLNFENILGLSSFATFIADLTEGLDSTIVKKCEKIVLPAITKGITMFCHSDAMLLQDVVYAAETPYVYEILDELATFVPDVQQVLNDVTVYDGLGDMLFATMQEYWDSIVHGTSEMSHDVYLKLFHLRKLRIDKVWDATSKSWVYPDIIALDEFQDSNPVTQAIFLAQKHCQLICVGDDAQSIYQWRGATGSFDLVKDFEQCYLTQSYRYSNAIAKTARAVLNCYYPSNETRLAGLETPLEDSSEAVLFRTNSVLLDYALNLAKGDFEFNILIDFKELANDLYHIEAVLGGKSPKFPSPRLRNVTDIATLGIQCKVDGNTQQLINLVGKMHRIGSVFSALQLLDNKVTKGAELTLTTIHKSKGLEFGTVTIWDDLVPSGADAESLAELLKDNVELTNLLYVAITRAKRKVGYNGVLAQLMGELCH